MKPLNGHCLANPTVYAEQTGDLPVGVPVSHKHECSKTEARCVYCGEALYYNCNGCGRYLTAAQMSRPEYRCEACA